MSYRIQRRMITGLVAFATSVLLASGMGSEHAQKTPDDRYVDLISVAKIRAERISSQELSGYLQFLASDALEGRDTPSRGLDIAGDFIASNLKAWGLKPAGDQGSFFQNVPLRRALVDQPHTQVTLKDARFAAGTDFIPAVIEGDAAGGLVYVGDGWFLPSKSRNPYQDIDIRGKIIVVLGAGLPSGVKRSEMGDGDEDPYSYAQHHGAVAVVRIPNLGRQYSLERSRDTAFRAGLISVPAFADPPAISYEIPGGAMDILVRDGTRIPMVTALPSLINALFDGEKLSAANIFQNGIRDPGASFQFSNRKELRISIKVKQETTNAFNVVGVLQGHDPTLSKEYVVIGAHYDHLGMLMLPSEMQGTDHNIYNGADDNGSGSAALLAVAHAFSLFTPPKRSIMFVWYCGEEHGEWGSRYITSSSPVPVDSIVTQINLDMIGRTRNDKDKDRNTALTAANEVYVVGSKLLSTEIGELSSAVNRRFLNLSFRYDFDDPNRLWFLKLSDDYNYLKKQIPIIYYFTGFHDDYHSTTDTIDKIDFIKMEKIARTVYATAQVIGQLDHRPRVDGKLPPEF